MRAYYAQYNLLIKKVLEGNFLVVKRACNQRSSTLGYNLSQIERDLLQVRIHIHRNHISSARKLLQQVQSPNDYFRAETYFLLGTVEFIEGHHEEAIIANQSAASLYQKLGDERGIFLSHYNIAVDYEKLGLIQLAKRAYESAREHCHSASEHGGYARAMASLYAGEGRYADALLELEKVQSHILDLEVVDRQAWDLLKAHIHVLNGNLTNAEEILKKVFQSKRCKEKTRVFFELQLIKFLLNDRAIPSPVRISRQYSELHLKWSLLYFLQHGRRKEATVLWDLLLKKYPQQFAKSFKILSNEEKEALFGRCLNKLSRQNESVRTPLLPESTQKRDMPGTLLRILKESAIPLSKEDLIELIWERYDSTYDARLYKLIERTKKKYLVNIASVQHAYRLMGN